MAEPKPTDAGESTPMLSRYDLARVSAHAHAVVDLVNLMLYGNQSEAQNQEHREYARQRLFAAIELLEEPATEPTKE